MCRYLLKIAFDGTDYHGWQVQPNGISVQEKLQDSLEKMFDFRPAVTGCSRTDAGVHANEFYCHFDLNNDISVYGIVKGLNSVLPNDIRALECKRVDSDFHCRYNAVAKNYIYRIDTSEILSPFDSRYAMHYVGDLNIEKMNEFCKNIVGTKDFCGFSSSKRTVTDTVRTIYECFVSKKDNIIELSITGNGFLYNMVRIIAGTALEAGQNRINSEDFDKIINSRDRSLAGKTLVPHGLFLNKVYYSGDALNVGIQKG